MLCTIAGQTSWVEPYPPNAKCRTSSSQSGRLIPENTIVTDTAMQQRIAIPARCARRDGDPTSTVVAAFMMDACATRSSAKPLPVPECNNRTPNPRTRNQVKVNTPCCVAKAVHYARSHPSARRTTGPIAPRGARAQDAFSFLSSIWDETANYRFGTVGVSSLFTSEDRPVPVPDGIVETLIQNSDEANLALFSSGLTTGQSVRILSGPFANFVGQLEPGRVRVLLDMMGTTVPVAVRRGGS